MGCLHVFFANVNDEYDPYDDVRSYASCLVETKDGLRQKSLRDKRVETEVGLRRNYKRPTRIGRERNILRRNHA